MADSENAFRTQRLGAYAVAFRQRSILLTRISVVGYPPGAWALPGGGVNHGESPRDAVVREVYEETGLHASDPCLCDVHDIHLVAPGRGDRFEDYHGVHLLYTAHVEQDVEPRVIEVGGTSDAAAWVPLSTAAELPLLPVVTHVLAHLDRFLPALDAG